MAPNIIGTLFLIVLLFACNTSTDEPKSGDLSQNKIVSSYKLRFKYTDSLAESEILLELIIENRNQFGVLVKMPFFKTEDVETAVEYTFSNLLAPLDYQRMPTYEAYEESLGNPQKNSFRYTLKNYVADSMTKRGEKFDEHDSDVCGYTFIEPSSTTIFMLDLTLIIRKVNREVKIYAYHAIEL